MRCDEVLGGPLAYTRLVWRQGVAGRAVVRQFRQIHPRERPHVAGRILHVVSQVLKSPQRTLPTAARRQPPNYAEMSPFRKDRSRNSRPCAKSASLAPCWRLL